VLVGGNAGWAARRLEMFLAMAELRDAFDPKSYPGLFSELIPPDREAALATMMRENIRPATVRAAGYIGAGDFLRSELGEPCLGRPTSAYSVCSASSAATTVVSSTPRW
jgi:hypothetical protein